MDHSEASVHVVVHHRLEGPDLLSGEACEVQLQ